MGVPPPSSCRRRRRKRSSSSSSSAPIEHWESTINQLSPADFFALFRPWGEFPVKRLILPSAAWHVFTSNLHFYLSFFTLLAEKKGAALINLRRESRSTWLIGGNCTTTRENFLGFSVSMPARVSPSLSLSLGRSKYYRHTITVEVVVKAS